MHQRVVGRAYACRQAHALLGLEHNSVNKPPGPTDLYTLSGDKAPARSRTAPVPHRLDVPAREP